MSLHDLCKTNTEALLILILIIDKLNWKGEAKKSGMQMGDIISNFKIENPDRPNKAIVYPFSFLLLLIFGYNNYRRKQQ